MSILIHFHIWIIPEFGFSIMISRTNKGDREGAATWRRGVDKEAQGGGGGGQAGQGGAGAQVLYREWEAQGGGGGGQAGQGGAGAQVL